jgi:hypothetical protein
MSAQENKAIFLRFIEELMRGNIGIVDEVCSPNFRQRIDSRFLLPERCRLPQVNCYRAANPLGWWRRWRGD